MNYCLRNAGSGLYLTADGAETGANCTSAPSRGRRTRSGTSRRRAAAGSLPRATPPADASPSSPGAAAEGRQRRSLPREGYARDRPALDPLQKRTRLLRPLFPGERRRPRALRRSRQRLGGGGERGAVRLHRQRRPQRRVGVRALHRPLHGIRSGVFHVSFRLFRPGDPGTAQQHRERGLFHPLRGVRPAAGPVRSAK